MKVDCNRSGLNLKKSASFKYLKYLSKIVAVSASLLAASTAFAEDVYRYKDSMGKWVFTDEKPEGQKYSDAATPIAQLQAKVAVVNRGTKDKPVLYAVSKVVGPVEVWLEFTQSVNVKFSNDKPFYWVITGPGEERLLEMEPQDPEVDWSYGWRSSFVAGAPVTATSLNKSPLGLPTKGGPFVVTQSFHGSVSHKQNLESDYAVDIAVPANTPVISVKSGMVMDTEKDFSRAGWSAEYADNAMMVRVLHRDGSMGLYAHFRKGGIEVIPGQKVKKGQLLGYSDTKGDHLHFALQINSGKKLVSVPFVFEGHAQRPKSGDILGPN